MLGFLIFDAGGIAYLIMRRPVVLSPLVAIPEAARVSLRVGDRLDFAAKATGSTGFLWSLSDTPVGFGRRWAYVPGPDEVGRRRVVLLVTGDGEQQMSRSWEVDVTAAIPRAPAAAEAPPPHLPRPTAALAPPPPPVDCARDQPVTMGGPPEDACLAIRPAMDGRSDPQPVAPPSAHQLLATRSLGTRPTTVPAREPPAVVAAPRVSEPPRIAPAAPAAAATPLREDEVRRWLDEYAGAWSRKDIAALRRMGQVRDAKDVAGLESYFRSVGELRVDVRARALRIDGERAVVEIERLDTITDPAGNRRELRPPPLTKELVRGADGLRLVDDAGRTPASGRK